MTHTIDIASFDGQEITQNIASSSREDKRLILVNRIFVDGVVTFFRIQKGKTVLEEVFEVSDAVEAYNKIV